jgi:hypothetical protein
VLSFEPLNIDNTVDNQTENTETTAEVIEKINDTGSDNSLLTNRQMTDLTGMKLESVRSRHKKSTSIEWQDKRYIPIKEGKYHKWQIVNDLLSSSDNKPNK